MGMGMYMNGLLTPALVLIYESIRELEWKLIRINYLKELQSEGDSLLEADEEFIAGHTESHIRICLDKFWGYVKLGGGLVSPNPFLNDTNNTSIFADLTKTQGCSTLIWKEGFDHKNKEDKVLCLSVGFAICFLNLKQTKDERCNNIPQPLPIISTLNLLERDMPCAMGLLKLDSTIYMIGGQRFPEFGNMYHKSQYPLWSCELFQVLYKMYGSRATCRHTYQLSLTEDSLSLSQCTIIPPLNKPIQWPIVEKIGNEIHVIASLPWHLDTYETRNAHHEVLDLEDLRRGWTQVPLSCMTSSINNHIRVGQRIFASSHYDPSYLAFDSKTREWIEHDDNHHHVSQILSLGDAKCVVEIENEKLKDPLFVVIGLGWYGIQVRAEAYLVNSTGHVICSQELGHLFEGFEQPIYGTEGRVIKVDDKENIMCALFHGYVDEQNLLFISTFRVVPKEFDRRWMKPAWSTGFSLRREFVRVDVMHSGVYIKEDVLTKDSISCPFNTVTGCII